MQIPGYQQKLIYRMTLQLTKKHLQICTIPRSAAQQLSHITVFLFVIIRNSPPSTIAKTHTNSTSSTKSKPDFETGDPSPQSGPCRAGSEGNAKFSININKLSKKNFITFTFFTNDTYLKNYIKPKAIKTSVMIFAQAACPNSSITIPFYSRCATPCINITMTIQWGKSNLQKS